MKPVCSLIASLIIGFGIRESQSSYVVVDSTLCQKYQAEPGKQEWITVIECISVDGSSIPPIVIFKGENLMTSWMPQPAPKVDTFHVIQKDEQVMNMEKNDCNCLMLQ